MQRLLSFLGLARETPSLDYLDRLVREHQARVPFETLTKLVDYEPGRRQGDFMPPLALYVDRIVHRGAGGLCWTLARGFHALLTDLGFDASLMLMAPGHCCVRVELPEGPQYADVGYAAPLFRAYPLFESFALHTPRERFEYRVGAEGIVVSREPGPVKRLDPRPRRLDELQPEIVAANDWNAPQSFLHRLLYARPVDGVFTSYRDGTLTRHVADGPARVEVDPGEAAEMLAQVFGLDAALYREAVAVQRRFAPAAGRPA